MRKYYVLRVYASTNPSVIFSTADRLAAEALARIYNDNGDGYKYVTVSEI